jgi:hypothetical protein
MRAAWAISTLAVVAMPARAAADACADARAALDRGDLVRASILSGDCDGGVAEVGERASARGYSPVEIVTEPAGGTVVVDVAADLPFRAPRRIWLPEGAREVTAVVDGKPVASVLVRVKDGNRALARISLPDAPVSTGAGTGAVDFGDDGTADLQHGPPPKHEFANLLPDRYRRGLDADDAGVDRAGTRARRWRLAGGVAAGLGDGAVAWGALAELAYGFPAGGDRIRWSLVPAAGAAVIGGRAAAVGAVRFEARLGPASASVGPSVTAGRDRGAGVVVTAGAARGAAALDVRADLPILGDVDPTVAVVAGLRW